MTRRVRIQVLVFCVLAALGVSYVSMRYVGLGRLVGVYGYEVSVQLPRTGGLFANAEVTYRGVPVGRVEQLAADRSGVTATVIVTDEDVRIPRDLDALVRNRSAIGEQYLDLRPRTAGAPYLADGDVVKVPEAALPMPIDGLLDDVVAFSRSLPAEDFGVLVDELYDASRSAGDDLRALLAASSDVVEGARPHLGATTDLIQRSGEVLQTQVDTSDSLRSFSTSLDLLAKSLATSDTAVRRVLTSGAPLAREMQALVAEVGQPVAKLIVRFLAIDQVLSSHVGDLSAALSRVPGAVAVVDRILGPDGLRFGLQTNFTDPAPCTAGTQPRRGPQETSDVPLHTSAGCTR